MKNLPQIIESCYSKVKTLEQIIPTKQYNMRMEEIDHIINTNNIWNDPKQATLLMKERQKISDLVSKLDLFKDQVSFYKECLDNLPEELEKEVLKIEKLEEELYDFEFKQIMNGPTDDNPAIITISAGAGGLEAANWVTMLLRMYLRYLDSFKFKVETLDLKQSEEHSDKCIDSVSIRVEGPYAYGFLKGEAGVHRLIRNSPFNAGDARHTSFAAVSVLPDIEDIIDIKINEKDLEITAQTAGGPGGQNVNRIKSAIRIKHIPTGINIIVRTERDQLSNKKTAFKLLKAKLYDLELKKKKEKDNEYIKTLADASFGNQIRTYTETPYSLIKDHRTDFQNSNFESVLNGNIHDFIISYLRLNR